MLVPNNWNAATAANATSAAATAYSESSRPVSSSQNLFSINVLLVFKTEAFHCIRQQQLRALPGSIGSLELLDLAGELVDLRADVGTQQLERGDCCQRDERCGHGVLGKFKTGFIT